MPIKRSKLQLLLALSPFGFAALGAAAEAPVDSAAASSRSPAAGAQERLVDRAVYRAAAHYRLAARQDIYPALAVAVTAARRGRNAAEIQAEVTRAQNAVWGRRDAIAEFTIAAAAALADADPLQALESTARGGAVHWTTQARPRTVTSFARAREQILGQYDDAYHDAALAELREFDRVFTKAVVGVSPDARREALVGVLPGRLQQGMLTLAAADADTLTREASSNTQMLWQEFEAIRGLSMSELANDLHAHLDRGQRQAEDDRQAESREVRINGAYSLVYLAGELVGLADKDAGTRITTVGNTVIGLCESWSKFKKASDALKGFAVATLTADFVTAAITLVGLFTDSGPTLEEQMLDNIVELSRQIEDARLQMHDRFDFVDKRLRQLHVDVAARLSALVRHVLDGQADVRRIATDLALELEDQRSMLRRVYPTLVDGIAVVLSRIDDASIGRCFNRKTMAASEFDSCLAQIRAIALDGGLARQQVPLPDSTANLQDVLESSPGAATAALAEAFAARQPSNGSRGACVPEVDPAAWALLARKHDEFLARWREHAELSRGDDGGYAELMRAHRDCILRFAHAIAADLVAFADSGNPRTGSAVGSLVADVAARADDVQEALRDAARAKRRDWRRVDGLDWRDPPDEWQRVPEEKWAQSLKHAAGHCEPDDWEEINDRGGSRSSTLAYYIAPEDVGGTYKARWEARYKHLDEALRRRLRRSVPEPLQSMAALGMGHLRVCAIGRVRDHGTRLVRPPADDDRTNTAGYLAEIDAEVLVAVRWAGRCGTGRFGLEADDTGSYRSTFRFDVQHRGSWEDPYIRRRYTRRSIGGVQLNLPPRISHERSREPYPEKLRVHAAADRSNERFAMNRAFRIAIDEVREEMRGWKQEADRACKPVYIDRYARTRDARLRVVEKNPAVQRAIANYDDTAARANALVRAWIRFAMQDARSDVVSGILSGAIRIPRWPDARSSDKQQPFEHVLNQHERLEGLTALYEKAIRSEEVRRLAASRLPGYPGIARARVVFDSLDPEHPVVLAHRSAETTPAHPGAAYVRTAASDHRP